MCAARPALAKYALGSPKRPECAERLRGKEPSTGTGQGHHITASAFLGEYACRHIEIFFEADVERDQLM